LKTLDRKGQIFSTDLMMASVVFLFILVIGIVYSTQAGNRIALVEEDNQRQMAALNAANALLLTGGEPGNWENFASLDSNISSIGIAKSRNEISGAKLQSLVAFGSTDYEELRQVLGVSKYGLGVSVLQLLDKESIAEAGQEPGTGDKVSTVNRIATYNGHNVIVRVKVFEE